MTKYEELAYWLNTEENDHYVNKKISKNDIIFPSHADNMNGEVVVTKLSDLK